MTFEEAGAFLMRREAIIPQFLNTGEVTAAGLSHFTVMQKIGHAQAVNKFNHFSYQLSIPPLDQLLYGHTSGGIGAG